MYTFVTKWDIPAPVDPIARPLFGWNHDVVMEWGRIGLVQRVDRTA